MQLTIDKTWTLFLDRDGVINQKLENDYVKEYDEFVFMPNVKETLQVLRKQFNRLIVVTNQQGIGKGLMTENDFMRLHWQIEAELFSYEVKFDKVYHCPDLSSKNSPNRKPQIGMALAAKNDFPDIDFAKSIMIGDSISDMEFGKKAGMQTIFFGKQNIPSTYIDYYAENWKTVRQLFQV
jgi:histidinol-phosphate phosphatase family protein